MKLIWSNLIYTFVLIEVFMPIAILILISMLLFIFKSKNDMYSKTILKYSLLTMLIYVGGYTLIIPEWRYLWFIYILIMVTSFVMIDSLYKNLNISINTRNILLFLLIFSFAIQPVIEVTSFYLTPSNNSYILSNNLKEDYGLSGNIASNNDWMEMYTISYYLNGKYYGIPQKTNNSLNLQQELLNNNIKYYFVWNGTEDLNLSHYHQISNGKIEGLKIYERNN